MKNGGPWCIWPDERATIWFLKTEMEKVCGLLKLVIMTGIEINKIHDKSC